MTARLVVQGRGGQSRPFPLNEPVTTIGRDRECGLALDYVQVSRLHARIERTDARYVVIDCDSTNGTSVNGQRIEGRRLLESGDEVGIGDIAITFLEDSADGLRAALGRARALARGEPAARKNALRLIDAVGEAAQSLGITDLAEQAAAIKLEAQGFSPADLQTSVGMVAATVYFQKPNLRRLQAADGTVTILFTDIEDSTPLIDRLGDESWMELLRTHNAIIRRHVSERGGFEVKAQGDGFMIAFKSPRDAVLAAVAIQRAFAAYNEEGPDEIVHVRIGLHTGEAVRQGDDFYGKNVIIATRVSTQARGGEIVVSSAVKTLVEDGGGIEFGEGREVELKGLPGLHTVFRVTW
jgi:class 3 adenylate cyclase/pSer/pThr/pTyr-binding forkhead associated (FHA) protein